MSTSGYVYRVSEQIRVSVILVGAVGVVPMRSKPRQRSPFDKTRRDPNTLHVRIRSRARTLKLSRDIRRRARRHRTRWNRHFFGLPLPVVPLADKAAPVLNVQIDRDAAHAKRRFLIAVGGSGHDIHA